jgi:hypothetical protein
MATIAATPKIPASAFFLEHHDRRRTCRSSTMSESAMPVRAALGCFFGLHFFFVAVADTRVDDFGADCLAVAGPALRGGCDGCEGADLDVAGLDFCADRLAASTSLAGIRDDAALLLS